MPGRRHAELDQERHQREATGRRSLSATPGVHSPAEHVGGALNEPWSGVGLRRRSHSVAYLGGQECFPFTNRVWLSSGLGTTAGSRPFFFMTTNRESTETASREHL